MAITATERTPLYLAPGVTYVTLTNSELMGNAIRTGLYMDAESGFNTIRSNSIHVRIFDEWFLGINRLGPQVSLDTSSNNLIVDNNFSALEGGGIYLFRNCGEGGTIRHGSSSYNQIINNVFFYNRYDGDNPSVFIGSRGQWWRSTPLVSYCGDDKGKSWGSSGSNDDHATHNVVMQNQIYKRSTSDMIRQGDESNRPNLIAHNDGRLTQAIDRAAGCYLEGGYKDLLLDGQSTEVTLAGNGPPECSRIRRSCSDGVLSRTIARRCAVRQVEFDCSVEGNNAGCSRFVTCPTNTRIVGARAACNLESGSVSSSQVERAPINRLSVVVPSDDVSDGICRIAGAAVRTGSVPIEDAFDRRSVSYRCNERDSNGGDCQVSGILYCR